MILSGRVVLDASVVVEALSPDAYGERAVAIFDAAGASDDIELWAPDLLYPETVSALRALVMRNSLEPSEAEGAIGRLLGLPFLIAGTAYLVRDAWRLRENVTVYDACYAVLARQLRGTMVTADERLVRALQERSVVHITEID